MHSARICRNIPVEQILHLHNCAACLLGDSDYVSTAWLLAPFAVFKLLYERL